MKKQFFAIIDSETTMRDTIADFSIVVCDRQGNIFAQCAVLLKGHYGAFELFHDKAKNDIWGYAGLERRKIGYQLMLANGTRIMASVEAVNRWIDKAVERYNPELTAYNLPFDENKCANTGIILSGFKSRFCLWSAAIGNICNAKGYRKFVLENHLFNAPTLKRNMTFSTSAESVAGYVIGQYKIEPHTALEDIIDFELPILQAIVKKRGWRDKIKPYGWAAHQVNQHFEAK